MYAGVTFVNFKTLSQEQVSKLDPMPSLVVLDVLDVLLPVLTNMINLSLEPCVFTSDWKEALLKLLFKSVDLTLLLRENFSGDRVK